MMNTDQTESIYTSFFSDDPDTVLAIYDSFEQRMQELLDSPDYTTEAYMEIYRAQQAYYRDHYAIINRHSDPL